jgi:hypothetical protein
VLESSGRSIAVVKTWKVEEEMGSDEDEEECGRDRGSC